MRTAPADPPAPPVTHADLLAAAEHLRRAAAAIDAALARLHPVIATDPPPFRFTQRSLPAPWLNAAEVADLLRVSVPAARRLLATGQIRGAHRIGTNGPWKVSPDAVAEFLARGGTRG